MPRYTGMKDSGKCHRQYLYAFILAALSLAAHGFHCCTCHCGDRGSSHGGVRASLATTQGSRVHGLQQLCCTGLIDLWHLVSSRTRDRTHVPSISRWILKLQTTREAPRNNIEIEGAESERRSVSFGQIVKERNSILSRSYKNFKRSHTIGFAFF